MFKREHTDRSMERTIATVKHYFKNEPNKEAIWNNPQSKDLTKRQQYFMWMIIHDAYKTSTGCTHLMITTEEGRPARDRNAGAPQTTWTTS